MMIYNLNMSYIQLQKPKLDTFFKNEDTLSNKENTLVGSGDK